MSDRRTFLRRLGVAGVAAPALSAGATGAERVGSAAAGGRAGASERAAPAVREAVTVSYDPAEARFRYVYDYEVPGEVDGFTVTVPDLSWVRAEVVTAENLERDASAFRWTGDGAPRLELAHAVGGEAVFDDPHGFAEEGAAFGPSLATELSWTPEGAAGGADRSRSFDGEGVTGDVWTFAGPHTLKTRRVDGVTVRVVVADGVADRRLESVDAMLDLFAFVEREFEARLTYDRSDTFVLPAFWLDISDGLTVGSSILLEEAFVEVEHVDDIPAHEYAHVLFGSFGDREMYWLTEGAAEYYGYLASFRHLDADCHEFAEAAYMEEPPDVALTDTDAMRESDVDYTKGAHVLAALDVEIRERSGGAGTLLDVMVADRDLTSYDGFEAAVVEAAGDDAVAEWLDTYVRSAETPPLEYVAGCREELAPQGPPVDPAVGAGALGAAGLGAYALLRRRRGGDGD